MKIGAIINPASGQGRMKRLWEKNRELIEKRLGNVHSFFTTGPGEASRIGGSLAKENYDIILVGGGDGTLHEVVNGLINENGEAISPETKIAILNGGTGCDFIKSLHIPTEIHEAVDIIKEARHKKVDVGRIAIETKSGRKDVYYINSSSVGVGGGTAERIAASPRSFVPASVNYLMAGVKEHFAYTPSEVRLTIGGEPKFEGIAQNIFICNGKYSGGGMYWAPEASLDDGEFDILLCKPISAWGLIPAVKKVYAGRVSELNEVTTYRSKEVRIQLPKEEPIEVDGEVYRGIDFTYTCLSQRLSFVVP